jgi:Na+-driven multidrug efflux pump
MLLTAFFPIDPELGLLGAGIAVLCACVCAFLCLGPLFQRERQPVRVRSQRTRR